MSFANTLSNGKAHHAGQNTRSFSVDNPERAQRWKEWHEERFEEIPLKIAISAYLSYAIYIFWGHVYELFRRLHLWHEPIRQSATVLKDFVPLYHDWEAFYTRHLYRRVRDCWNRPIASSPDSEMTIMERITNNSGWTFFMTGRRKRVINMGSYNYLGFSQNAKCEKAATATMEKYSLGLCSFRQELGNHAIHRELEALVARFAGQEDAITFQMGFATNALNIPTLVDKHCCLVSDEYNHSSIVLGARLSGAKIVVFKHNDMQSLEHVLQEAVVNGRSRTRRPYKKIIILVEGIYRFAPQQQN
jgi:serine palmitoyltransferase